MQKGWAQVRCRCSSVSVRPALPRKREKKTAALEQLFFSFHAGCLRVILHHKGHFLFFFFFAVVLLPISFYTRIRRGLCCPPVYCFSLLLSSYIYIYIYI